MPKSALPLMTPADLSTPSGNPPCAPRTEIDCLTALAHELRTPLSAILGMAELLENAEDLQKVRRQSGVIRESALTMHTILDEMFDYARIRAENAPPSKMAPFDPAALLAELNDRFAIQARAAGIDFLTDPPDSLPERLIGDALRTGQALTNLLTLALKLTPRGEIRLTIRFLPASHETIRLRCEIRASGNGLNNHQCKALFKPLSSGHQSLPGFPYGSGFGPAIAKGWIGLMAGSLRIRCRPEKGALFRIEIPFCHSIIDIDEKLTTLPHVC
ncbi:MAG: HAMP domain-containing histidine kinase [Magnetococcus sp. YQC-9]